MLAEILNFQGANPILGMGSLSIVTVEGEDFLNSREEKECYKLVRESTKFIYDRLEEFSKYNCKTASDELNRHMRNMFKNMRSSLKEEVGSIKKDFL